MTAARVKYPKTMHLPWSPGLQNDDRVMPNLDMMIGREVVVTEKMDGENTTMYRNGIHARSIDGRHHNSRNWVKRFWGEHCLSIPPGTRVCGENVYAQHSIAYDDLDTYFYAFGIWDGPDCLHWDSTRELFKHWGFTPVPTIWRGEFDIAKLREIANDMDLDKQEGYVVRLVESFKFDEFAYAVGKYVRANHVQSDEHWMHKEIIPNGLKENV